jgi:hydrogenase maturation protease
MTNTLIIGLGSDLRGDDSVGLIIARRLHGLVQPGIKVIEYLGDGLSLITAWQDADVVIVVDAVKSGAAPGTIHRFDALSAPLQTQLSTTTSHAFGLGEAIELAHQLDQLPQSLVIYGIEGKSFDLGTELSAEVEQAAEEVVTRLLQEIGSE